MTRSLAEIAAAGPLDATAEPQRFDDEAPCPLRAFLASLPPARRARVTVRVEYRDAEVDGVWRLGVRALVVEHGRGEIAATAWHHMTGQWSGRDLSVGEMAEIRVMDVTRAARQEIGS